MRYLLLLVCFPAFACTSADVKLLAGLGELSKVEGVVFEIVEDDIDALDWALPRVRSASDCLKQKNPDVEIAVVSHGKEMLALTNKDAASKSALHTQIQQLGAQGADFHVCAVHASWYQINPEDFGAHIDVAPAGPIQIEQYQELGYQLILVEPPAGE